MDSKIESINGYTNNALIKTSAETFLYIHKSLVAVELKLEIQRPKLKEFDDPLLSSVKN